MAGPLDGVRVLDLTTTFSGPFCTLLMSDLGAEVIKVESPRGDVTRELGTSRSLGMGSVFMHNNRGKRAIALDLKSAAGTRVLERLTTSSDVFVHNMRNKAADKLHVDYESIRRANQQIVYCAISGFSSRGPNRDKPAYEDTIQGASGLAHLQSTASGEPRYIATSIADKTTGLTALYGVLAALYHRERTGEGQYLEVPMFETLAAYALQEHIGGWLFEPPNGPLMYPRQVSPKRRPQATADGHICLMVYLDKHWEAFFKVIGRNDIWESGRYKTMATRVELTEELYTFMATVLSTRSTREWLEIFESVDIPAMPMNSLESLFEESDLTKSGLVKSFEHPSEGPIRIVPAPVEFDRTPIVPPAAAPRLGEHGIEILRDAGFSELEIDALAEEQVLRLRHGNAESKFSG